MGCSFRFALPLFARSALVSVGATALIGQLAASAATTTLPRGTPVVVQTYNAINSPSTSASALRIRSRTMSS